MVATHGMVCSTSCCSEPVRLNVQVEGLSRIDASDTDPRAVAAIKRNAEHNGGAAAELVRPIQSDARMVMYQVRALLGYCGAMPGASRGIYGAIVYYLPVCTYSAFYCTGAYVMYIRIP